MTVGDERFRDDDNVAAPQELRTRMGLGVLGRDRRARANTMLVEVTLPDDPTMPVACGAPRTALHGCDSTSRLPVGAQVGRWRITDVMADGGTCEIYGVVHVHKTNRGVLRLAKPRALEAAPGLAVRMHDNARELLHHTIEHLYQIYSYGWVNGACRRPYVITERLVGDNLEVYLRKHGLMEWRRAALVVEQAARAMVGFHALGRVHCDLSPGNLVVQELGDALYVTVIDVDFARSANEPKSPGYSPGTPGFIPPEHALEVRPTVAFDIFALGSVLIYAITGRPAIDPAEYCRIIALGTYSVQQHGWATLRQRPDIPPALVDLARRLTHPDRAVRPGSAAEVAERLRAIRLAEAEAEAVTAEARVIRRGEVETDATDEDRVREPRRKARRSRRATAPAGVAALLQPASDVTPPASGAATANHSGGHEPRGEGASASASASSPTLAPALQGSRAQGIATGVARWSAGERALAAVAVGLVIAVAGWIAAASTTPEAPYVVSPAAPPMAAGSLSAPSQPAIHVPPPARGEPSDAAGDERARPEDGLGAASAGDARATRGARRRRGEPAKSAGSSAASEALVGLPPPPRGAEGLPFEVADEAGDEDESVLAAVTGLLPVRRGPPPVAQE